MEQLNLTGQYKELYILLEETEITEAEIEDLQSVQVTYLLGAFQNSKKEKVTKRIPVKGYFQNRKFSSLVIQPNLNDTGDVISFSCNFEEQGKLDKVPANESMSFPGLEIVDPNKETEFVIFTDQNEVIQHSTTRSGSIQALQGYRLSEVLLEEIYSEIKNAVLLHDTGVISTSNSNSNYNINVQRSNQGWMVSITGLNPVKLPLTGIGASQYFTRYILDNIPTDIAVWDLNHTYLYINKTAVKNEEIRRWLIGKDDFQYCAYRNIPSAVAAKRRMRFNQAQAQNKPVSWMESIDTPEGKKHFFRVYDIIRNADGLPMLMVGYALDFTQNIEDEKVIRNLQVATDNASDGIALCDKDGVYYYMNQKHAEIFKYDNPEELLGKTWHTVYGDEEIKRIGKEVFPKIMANGQWIGRTLGKSKYGTDVIQEIALTALPDNQLLCICRDISYNLEQEATMQKLAIVAEKTNSAVLITDKEFNIEWVNQSFGDITGYTFEEAKGKKPTFLEGGKTSRDTLANLWDTLARGDNFIGEILNYAKDGREFWSYTNISAVKNDAGAIEKYIAIFNDITTMKQAEEKLLESLTKEKELSDIKSRFVSLASHELRTPLTAIQSRIDIAKIHTERSGEALMLKQLEVMQEEMDKIANITDKVLLAGKIDQESLSLNLQETYLEEFMHDVCDNKLEEKQRNVTIEISQTGEPKAVKIDRSFAGYLFGNLIGNAIKYSPDNKAVKIHITYSDNSVSVDISDKGIGIPKEEIKDIFTAFYRARNVSNIRGTGLGLYLVKYFTDAHNGTINVKSEVGKGSTFTITLPIHIK
jgi:PAS domain S-box-containing protein